MRKQIGNKAELELKIVVGAILSIAFIIGSVIMGIAIGKLADESAKKAACKDSLKLSAIKLEGLADTFGNPVDIKCYTEYLEYSETDEMKIKKIIADKMVECWDIYGRGKMELFETEDNNYCVVCSRLSFKEATELEGFTLFLNNNIAPLKKMSYLEYLAEVDISSYEDSGFEESEFIGYDVLPVHEPLAVMFTMGKNANPDSWWGLEGTKLTTTGGGTAIGTAAGIVGAAVAIVAGVSISLPLVVAAVVVGGAGGGTLGYFAGASRTADWNANVAVWPYDRIGELDCTYIEGKSGSLEIVEGD